LNYKKQAAAYKGLYRKAKRELHRLLAGELYLNKIAPTLKEYIDENRSLFNRDKSDDLDAHYRASEEARRRIMSHAIREHGKDCNSR
jgi:hypothetical protein